MKRFFKKNATLIVANGEKPALSFFERCKNEAARVIALDGAASWLLKLQSPPDLVIGDMDSADEEILAQLPHFRDLDQESNDLEKALKYCEQKHLHNIVILGAFGLRLDHVLTNIYVVKKFAPTMTIVLRDEKQCAFICPKGEYLTIDAMTGASLSLFPLGEDVGPITSTGVAYPLVGEYLSWHYRIGTLNRIVEDQATIHCEAGDLLVLLEQRSAEA